MGDDGDELLAAFVAARGSALLSIARRLTSSRADAEDLLQHVLVRTAAAWPGVLRQDDPEGYVRQALARAAMDRWRRRGREVPVDRLPDTAGADEAAPVDARDEMLRALALLPPRQRAVLVLRYDDGLSEAEIAGVLEVRPGTVKSQAARGLAALRRTVDALAEQEARR